MTDNPLLPQELLAEFARVGQVRSYPKNTIVVHEGEPAEAMYTVLEGTLRVYVADEDGKEAELNTVGPGQYFGELMLGSHVRTASVRTLTPARLTMVKREDFERIIAARPDMAFHVIQTLINRVKALTDNVRSLVLMDVYGRVARMFLEMAHEVDGKLIVPGPLSQQKIADRVGASRSMINRILKDLTEGGYITIGKTDILVNRGLPKRW